MVRYKETKEFFKMKFTIKEEEEVDDSMGEIKKLIRLLKNDNFGNAEKRKEFVKIISQIALSNDPESRKVIKALGNFMTSYDIGDIEIEVDADGNAELEIKSKKSEKREMKKKIVFKSKHMKEMYGDMMDEMGYDVVDSDIGFEDEFVDDTVMDAEFVDDTIDMDDSTDIFIDDDFEDEFIDDTIEDEEDIFMDDEFVDDGFDDASELGMEDDLIDDDDMF